MLYSHVFGMESKKLVSIKKIASSPGRDGRRVQGPNQSRISILLWQHRGRGDLVNNAIRIWSTPKLAETMRGNRFRDAM